MDDGETVDNRAGITFDYENPILTPTWTNIMDNVKPTSTISALEIVNDSVFNISFAGEDNRSGIWKYTLYVQQGLGANWIEAATDIAPDSTYTYKGFDCIDYGFCVLATDSAGNVEQKTLTPEVRKYALLLGDANNDGVVNVVDLNSTVNYIMEKPAATFKENAADVNRNGKVNVADLNGIVNIIMSEETNESPVSAKAKSMVVNSQSEESLYSNDIDVPAGETHDFDIYLNNATDVSSVQFDLTLPEGVSAVQTSNGAFNITLTERAQSSHSAFGEYKKNGNFRVVAYSTNNQDFAGGSGKLMTIRLKVDDNMKEGTYDAVLSNVILGTSEEQTLKAAGGQSNININGTTSIHVVSADGEDAAPGYNLSGKKRQKHEKGVKVTKDQKVLIK